MDQTPPDDQPVDPNDPDHLAWLREAPQIEVPDDRHPPDLIVDDE